MPIQLIDLTDSYIFPVGNIIIWYTHNDGAQSMRDEFEPYIFSYQRKKKGVPIDIYHLYLIIGIR